MRGGLAEVSYSQEVFEAEQRLQSHHQATWQTGDENCCHVILCIRTWITNKVGWSIGCANIYIIIFNIIIYVIDLTLINHNLSWLVGQLIHRKTTNPKITLNPRTFRLKLLTA